MAASRAVKRAMKTLRPLNILNCVRFLTIEGCYYTRALWSIALSDNQVLRMLYFLNN